MYTSICLLLFFFNLMFKILRMSFVLSFSPLISFFFIKTNQIRNAWLYKIWFRDCSRLKSLQLYLLAYYANLWCLKIHVKVLCILFLRIRNSNIKVSEDMSKIGKGFKSLIFSKDCGISFLITAEHVQQMGLFHSRWL